MASVRILRKRGSLSRLAACALLAGSCFAAAGCDQSEKTRQVIDQRSNEARQSLDAAQKPNHTLAYDPLTVSNRVWSGNAALRMQRGMPLPPRFEAPRGVTLVSADPMSLNDIAAAISAQTGIPIRLNSLSMPNKAPSASSSGFIAASAGSVGSSAGSNSSDAMPISYEGPLSGLLERLSAYFGVSWRYDGASISVARYETRIFVIEALPGTQKSNEGMQDDVSGGGGGGGGGGGSGGGGGGGSGSGGGSSGGQAQNSMTQNSNFTIDFKYWEELNQVLTSIIGSQGSAVVSPTMGTVTITTTADVMSTVSDYLAKENKRLSRQIAINVQIYSVNLGQSEDFNIAFTGFLRNLTKFSGLNYTTAAAPVTANPSFTSALPSFGSLSVAILNGPNDPTAHAGDVFNALSTIGDTTEVAQFPMTTLNNHPVSRRIGTDTTYISQVTQNTTAATSTSTIVTPTTAVVHDGFSLQLTPRLLDDGRILMQYSLGLIGLDSLETNATYGIALPVTDNRLFVQQSMLRSGQTLIIGGADLEKLTQNKNGVGSPNNFLLGGGVSSYNNHLMLFMSITPQVMDLSDEEHG